MDIQCSEKQKAHDASGTQRLAQVGYSDFRWRDERMLLALVAVAALDGDGFLVVVDGVATRATLFPQSRRRKQIACTHPATQRMPTRVQ
jgi:hypothetical protein